MAEPAAKRRKTRLTVPVVKTAPSDLLLVWFPGGAENCEENDGTPAGLFLVVRSEFNAMHSRLQRYHRQHGDRHLTTERDCSNGGHGCILTTNFFEELKTCQIVVTNPDLTTQAWVKKIERRHFWNALKDAVNDECETTSDEERAAAEDRLWSDVELEDD